VGQVIIVQPDTQLAKIIEALGPPRGLSGRLNGGKQQGNEDADDRDYYE
jgi:hypothetical protein